MARQLLSALGKRGDSSYTTTGIRQGLDTLAIDIEDTAHLSKYFRVVEFNPVFTAGKNSVSFNGSDLLLEGSEIKIEVLDSQSNSLYLTSPPQSANYIDIANFTVAIYVYGEIADGAGSVILVGTTAKGQTVRWVGNITINTTYKNVSRVRFFNTPKMEIRPLLLPAIDITTGATMGVSAMVTGSCTGAPRNPVVTATNQPTSDYRVDWTTFSSSLGGITGFNSEMVGATILLYVNTAVNPLYTRPIITDTVNSTQSFKIVKVISPSELMLDGDVVDTTNKTTAALISPSFVGAFSINYTQTNYLNQAPATPCVGTYVGSTNSTMLITNNAFFTESMIGNTIQVNYNSLTLVAGTSTYIINPAISSSTNRLPVSSSNYVVQNILGSHTASITPIYYTLFDSSNPHILSTTTYTASKMTGNVMSSSASNQYQYYTTAFSSSVLFQKSYMNAVYRNLDTFSGMVARQKIYAKSNIYPGDYELISDTPIGPSELLYDPITINKNYSDMGMFYNQDQINHYWYASTPSLTLVQSDSPVLSAMTIKTTPDYTAANGIAYVIAKTSAIDVHNDDNYYPYDETSFNNFSGNGYTSNFIFLAEQVLYMLSSNIIINKNPTVPAKVSFYITSSSPGISGEPNFDPRYGLKIGEISVAYSIASKVFSDVQKMYFTPMHDYYGTLVIVPYQCDVTLTNLSMVNYGDYGFSPQGAMVQVPFPINVANESFTIKADLYDNNSNLVFSIPPTVQTFDPSGTSLYGSSVMATNGSGSNSSFTNIPLISPPMRFLAYQLPQKQVGYTSVSNISLIPTNTNDASSVDYINIEVNGNTIGRSLALKYSGSNPNVFGRRVYVDTNGNKTTYL